MTIQTQIEEFSPELNTPESLIDDIVNQHLSTEANQPEEEELTEYADHPEEGETSKFQDVKNLEEPDKNQAVKNLIDTDILVVLADIILSRLFFLLFNKGLKKDVAAQDFELTPEESKSISKILKEYLKTVNISISPANALIFGVLSIYAGKAIMAYTAPKRDLSEHKTVKQQTKSSATGKRRGAPTLAERAEKKRLEEEAKNG